jgi:hypothetical protein
VEQERQRLLMEHAQPLAGYLPKVCLKVGLMFRECLGMQRIWICLIENFGSSLRRASS